MTHKPERTSQRTINFRDELIFEMNTATDKDCVYHCANGML